MNRYRLRLTNGEEIIFEARGSDVLHGDSGITVWEYKPGRSTPVRSRFFPYVNILESTSQRVSWQRVAS